MRILITFLFLFSCREDLVPENYETSGITAPTDSEKVFVKMQPKIDYMNNLKKNSNVEDVEARHPYLIYYAIDSTYEEPFLKDAIDFETKTLRDICKIGHSHVNWIIIRNTDIVNNKTYEVCKSGELKRKDITYLVNEFYKQIDEFYKEKPCSEMIIADERRYLYNCPNFIFTLNHGPKTRNKEIAEILKKKNLINQSLQANTTEYDLNKSYYDYPLVHERFFRDITGDRGLNPFPKEKFVPVFHIKSHGHIDFSILGLFPHQLINKVTKQTEMKRQKTAEELGLKAPVLRQDKFVKKELINIFKSMKWDSLDIESQLRTLDISGEFGGEYLSQDDICGLGVGGNFLGEIGNFLGESSALSLGVGNVYFGNQTGMTPKEFLLAVTRQENEEVFNNYKMTTKKDRILHLFMESCDSSIGGTRWPIVSNHVNDVIPSMYTSEGSLWYRNIDWNLLFNAIGLVKDHSKHAAVMQSLLIKLSEKIPNFVPKDKKEHENYLNNYNSIINDMIEKRKYESKKNSDNN